MARATPSARFLETEPRRWKNETLMDRLRPQKKPYPLSRSDIPLPTGAARFRRTLENSTFCHRGLAAKIDVVGAVLGSILVLLGPSQGSSWVLFGASRALFAGLRVTESGSVAGSGAQPLLDNIKL